DRIFASLGPTPEPDPGVSEPLPTAGVGPSADDVGQFLLVRPNEGSGSVVVIPGAEASRTGAHPGAASVALPVLEDAAPQTAPRSSWTVTVLGLNGFG